METLIRAFITSRIDYCSSHFMDVSAKILSRLRHVYSSAKRLPAWKMIQPSYDSYHWIGHQSNTLRFSTSFYSPPTRHFVTPPPCYIAEFLHLHTPACNLRSCDAGTLRANRHTRSRLASWGGTDPSHEEGWLHRSLRIHCQYFPLHQCLQLTLFKLCNIFWIWLGHF